MILRLRPAETRQIHAHLARAYPEEGCGMLLGRERDGVREVERVVAVENHHPDTRRERYTIDPGRFLAAERDARREGLEVLGFFHSHPDRAPQPSAFDLERAWPYYSYLIVSVSKGLIGEQRSWRLRGDRSGFDPERLDPASEPDLPALSPAEMVRYSRHLALPEVGIEGQRRLKAASVLVIGAGGLGSPLALYLAAAGVGRIGLVDFDQVEESNLQRQILHGTSGLGRSKLDSARARLEDLNPGVRIETHEARLTRANALEILGGYDVVADGTDNFPTRYLVNDACVMLGKPNVHGSIFRFEGQASVFDAARGPCYRCLYPDPPPPGLVPSCAEGGVLGVLPGVIGVIQGIETIKLILGVGEPLIGRLLLFDALAMSFREVVVSKDPACPLCGERRTITELIDYERFCGLSPVEQGMANASQWEITPRELKARLDRGDELVLIDVREPHEERIARFDGATLVPLRSLPARAKDLDPSREIVLICHHGNRSMRALEFLRDSGFRSLKNLRGGIDAWSRDVNPGVPRY